MATEKIEKWIGDGKNPKTWSGNTSAGTESLATGSQGQWPVQGPSSGTRLSHGARAENERRQASAGKIKNANAHSTPARESTSGKIMTLPLPREQEKLVQQKILAGNERSRPRPGPEIEQGTGDEEINRTTSWFEDRALGPKADLSGKMLFWSRPKQAGGTEAESRTQKRKRLSTHKLKEQRRKLGNEHKLKERRRKSGNENPWRHLNGKTEESSSAGSSQRHEQNGSRVPTKLGAGW
jgi:hypothetical protein